jgi:hypothetical protein
MECEQANNAAFGKCLVPIPAGTLAILTQISRDFPQCVHSEAGIVPELGQDRFL